ncbi:hypothetical protein SEA_CHRIS_78 [Mycobacterium phage Chris]|uniref:Uncharacterized protein n=1 Tax=Mycobacterium phage Chris TaxID=2725626 RepID=A0A6M3SZ30_9CAUD|nr:hypothetical protein I5G96_gp027 [Mycobacterium phage Chris]QJD50480.1 hypothetical protein SEA_CHRIS_78 [Mycobacterium phage Chris]
MNNLTARNLDGVSWINADGDRAEYMNGRYLFGVVDTEGRWLSFDGVQPYVPQGGRKTAIEVAATIVVDDSLHWIAAL